MRYLNLNVILASTVLFFSLACGDSGNTDGASETGTGTGTDSAETANETGSAEGDGDGDTGDGDGDTGDGDGDTGDGDGDTGDGDGDTGDGDGDGDGDAGDGDGDGACVPSADTPCATCTAENCCDELTACKADEDCGCLNDCFAQVVNPMSCFQMCGLEPNGLMNPQLMALRECTNSECMQECMIP